MTRSRNDVLRALFVGALLAAGCYESHDAPLVAQRDGGLQRLDGGASLDAAVPADATMPPFDGPPLRDEDADGAADCGDVVAPYVGPGCADETRECIAACPPGVPECMDGCLVGDAECDLCATRTVISCANSLGCQGAWNEFACCAQASSGCSGARGAALVECAPPACDDTLVDYEACLGTIDRTVCAEKVALACGLPME